MTRAKDISKILTDANISGTLDVSGAFTSQGIDDNADAVAITIDSSERVGIGESSPAAPLHIETGTATDIIRFGTNGRWGFQRANSDSRYLSLSKAMNGSSSSVLAIDGDNSNVGIGTTTPSAKLTVEGTLSVRTSSSQAFNDSNNANNLTMNDSKAHFNVDGADKDFQVSSDSNSNMLFVDGGNNRVGIGMIPDTSVLVSLNGGIGTTNGGAGGPTHTFYSDADTGMFRAGANNLGFTTGGSERLRIDSSGNVGIGLTSADRKLVIKDTGTATVGQIIHIDDNNSNATGNPLHINYSTLQLINSWSGSAPSANGTKVAKLAFATVTTSGYGATGSITCLATGTGHNSGALAFNTGSNSSNLETERMRIASNGYIEFRGASQVRVNLGNAGTAGTNNSNWIRGSGNQVDLNTNGGGYGFEVSGNTIVQISTTGSLANGTGAYNQLSDETLKENIADASSQWNDIKALRIRKYSMIADELDKADKIGVIAQELETSGMNGLVEETKWNNQSIKLVKQSILYMKSVKALQEAMTRIETLESEVKALKGA